MTRIILAIAFIGLAQCAKLDHLKYLPPDSRPANKEAFDQGLAAPTTGQAHESFGAGSRPQTESFGRSLPVEPQPVASGSFNANTQNAARLQGSPFIPHGSQSKSFGGFAPSSQPSQSYFSGQQTLSEPKTTNGPSAVSTTVSSIYQSPQSSAESQKLNQPQSFIGSNERKPSTFTSQTAGPQDASRFQGPYNFGNTVQTSQISARPQDTKSNQGSYGTQSSLSDNTQSSIPHSSVQNQGSTSSSTFPGATGSGAAISQSSPFAKISPGINDFNSQTTGGTFRPNDQASRGFGLSTVDGNNISPIPSHSSGLEQTQTNVIGGQQQELQSSRSLDSPSASFETTYSKSNQAPASYESGKSVGLFSDRHSASTQPKYQPSPLNQIPIIRLDTKNYGDGTYSTAYETGNGIQAEEQGQTQGDSSIAQGSYSYTSPEGEKVGISYTADEDGYHPQGEHLPTPPPVPEAILRSLEYNKAHPEEENDDGSYREPDSNDSTGQFRSSPSQSPFSGSSNKYLAPISSSGVKSHISGSLSPLVRGGPTGSTAGSVSLPSNVPASNQASFAPSSYPTSSGNNDFQGKSESHISSPGSSNYDNYSSQSNGNTQPSVSSSYQYNSPAAFGPASNGPNTNTGRAFPSTSSKSFQGSGSISQPTQMSGFSSHSRFNPSLNVPSGSFVGKDSKAYQQSSPGQFNSQDSVVVQSSTPEATNIKQGNNVSSGTGSLSPTAPQKAPSGQVSSYNSVSRPSAETGAQYGNSFGPSSTNAPYKQSSYQNANNVPVRASGTVQDLGNVRFGVQGANTENKPNQGLSRSQGQQNIQTSYSSGPSATKSTQFSGYQYNAPNAPFGNSGSLQQGGFSEPKGFSSGTSQHPEGLPNTKLAPTAGSQIAEGLPNNKFAPAAGSQSLAGLPNTKFAPEAGSSKITSEFGPEVFRGNTGPVRTPGVQQQDENGGYLY